VYAIAAAALTTIGFSLPLDDPEEATRDDALVYVIAVSAGLCGALAAQFYRDPHS
jgi:hypothetical protein